MPDIFDIIHATKRLERKKLKKADEEISLDDFVIGDSSGESQWIANQSENPFVPFSNETPSEPSAFEQLVLPEQSEADFMAEKEKEEKQNNLDLKLPKELLDMEIGAQKQKRKKESRKMKSIDLVSVNAMKSDKQARVLKTEYLSLLDKFNELATDLDELEDKYNNNLISFNQYRNDLNNAKEIIRKIARHFPKGSSLKSTLDGSNWNFYDIQDEVLVHMEEMANYLKNTEAHIQSSISEIKTERDEARKQITKLETELFEKEKEIRTLKSSPIIQTVPTYDSTENEKIEEEPSEIIETKTPINPIPPKPEPKNDDFATSPVPAEEPENSEEIDTTLLLNATNFISSLPDGHKYVIRAVGEHGFSRTNELFPFIENDEEGKTFFFRNQKFNKTEAHNVVKGLRDANLLDAESINYGSRGNNFVAFNLSSLGKAIYNKMTGKKAIQSEKEYLIGQHSSTEHGYLIKDIASLLEKGGLKVYTSREDLTYKIDSATRKVFDLAIDGENGKKVLIEVERGTHNEEDFLKAMNKIHKITNEFYFICPGDNTVHQKTQPMFYKWIKSIGGVQAVRGKITVSFSTYEKVKQFSEGKLKKFWVTTPL